MIRRWRSILRSEGTDSLASPHPGEAFGGWMLGTLAALVCLWLGDMGTHSLLPGVLVAALLALLGWRHIEWLFWLPPVLVLAALLQAISPSSVPGRFGATAYVDMLMAAVAVIAVVRAVALRRRPIPRTPLDRLMVAVLCLAALTLLPPAQQGSLARVKTAAVCIGIFYAATAIASRAGGSRWMWPAYPLAVGLVSVHAVVGALRGPGVLEAQSRAADAAWFAPMGLLNSLLCALPVCIGLALDAGHTGARRMWRIAAILGTFGVGVHLVLGDALDRPRGWETLEDPLRFSVIAVTWLALVAMGRMAWQLGHRRQHERPRWLALAVTMVTIPLLQLGTNVLGSPTAQVLLATGGGLIVGTWRAEHAVANPILESAPDSQEAA